MRRLGSAVAVMASSAWVVTLVRILRHRIYASHDTLISYAHVWYISRRLWHDHVVPFRMPVLGHGRGLAFPYASIPWLTAAIFRPLVGDWIVTLWLVVGFVGVVVTTYVAFPELRRGWWAVVALANPALFAGPLSGQLPFLWASAMFLGAIACWRRDQVRWAIVLAALAQITHPAILGPMVAVIVALRLWVEPDRPRLLKAWIVATVPALPFAALVFASPVFVDSSLGTRVYEFAATLGPRGLIVVVPIAAAWLSRRKAPEVVALMGSLACVAGTAVTWGNQDMDWITKQLSRQPDSLMTDFTKTADFEPGRVYRVLRSPHEDGKTSMYQVLKGGATLDGEFFPESLLRQSFADEAEYSAKLRDRMVDVVVLFDGYGHNEGEMLRRLSASTHPCDRALVCVRLKFEAERYRVYDVDRS